MTKIEGFALEVQVWAMSGTVQHLKRFMMIVPWPMANQ